jgi:hypothetical protein
MGSQDQCRRSELEGGLLPVWHLHVIVVCLYRSSRRHGERERAGGRQPEGERPEGERPGGRAARRESGQEGEAEERRRWESEKRVERE